MKLIFVHGRSQGKKSAQEIESEWLAAFNRGLQKLGLGLPSGVEVKVPFYGKRLDELLDQLKSSSLESVILRGSSDDAREAEFRYNLLREIAQSQNITDAEVNEAVGAAVHERGPLNWEWVQGLLKALDRTPLGSAAIEAFTGDVYAYLHNQSVRTKINGIVYEAFEDTPCVVVAHSLGTVVGYNVLRAILDSLNVIKYVTLGSPLGIKAIRNSLEPPLRMPACCQQWYNAFDEADVVALHSLDRGHFPVDPPITNNDRVHNHTDNRHGIDGYLDNFDVVREIHSAL